MNGDSECGSDVGCKRENLGNNDGGGGCESQLVMVAQKRHSDGNPLCAAVMLTAFKKKIILF